MTGFKSKRMANQYDPITGHPFPSMLVLDEAMVDGEKWRTVKCNGYLSKWIRTQNDKMWHNHIDSNWTFYQNTFDVNEKIYTLLLLLKIDK